MQLGPDPAPIAKADDLTVATLVAHSDAGARWAACFHAQQAAEKALKAIMATRGIDFPFTHALDRLADLAGGDIPGVDRSMLVDVSPWAVAGRYPEDIPEPTPNETRRLVDGARGIVAAVRAHLQDY